MNTVFKCLLGCKQLIFVRQARFFTIAACSFSLLFSSCKGDKNQSTTNTLKLYLQAEPMSLDPRAGGDRRSQMLLRELYEGLYRIDENGLPAPALAQDLQISQDQKKYTFTLKDAKWSNGDPVTAYDFEYSWKSNLTPSFISHYPYAFFIIKNGRKARTGELSTDTIAVKAINDKILEVELEHPAPYFLELLANPLYSPVHAKTASKYPNWYKNAGSQYISNGPFTLNSWDHQAEVVLQKNKNYWDSENVKLQRITFAIIENPQTALNMYERQDIDWVGEPFGSLPLDSIPALARERRLETYQIGGIFWFLFNTNTPLLSSPKIRKALAYAIDRDEITKHLLQGGETPAYTLLPPKFSLLAKPLFRDHDTTMAKKLLREGLNDLKVSKVSLPPALVITHWSDPRDKAVAEAVQEQWQKTLGIQVQLSPCDWATYMAKVRTADFETIGSTWFTWYKDPMYNLEFIKFKDSGFNGTRWENLQYIQLLDLADNESDPDKRREYLAQAESLVIEEMPLAPVYNHTYKFVKQAYVQGVYLSPVGQLELKNAYIEYQ